MYTNNVLIQRCIETMCKVIPFAQLKFTRWGRVVERKADELEKSQWYNKQKIMEMQKKKMRKLCKTAYQDVPYYKRVFDQAGLNPEIVDQDTIKKLPVLTRKDIRENYNFLINPYVSKKNHFKNSTGGSTGEPLHFINDFNRNTSRGAINRRQLKWMKYYPEITHLKLWGASTDLSQDRLKNKFFNFVYRRKYIDAFNITPQTMEEAYKIINKNSLVYIESYSNILYEFARYILEIKKTILPVWAIVSSAGTLYDFYKSTIEKAFLTKVFNRYGSREFGNIAHECERHEGMHIHDESFFVEALNGTSEEPGELLITDLDNFAFPFIRYAIGDKGIISEIMCSCGRGLSLLQSVVGRTLDFIITPSGKKISGEMFPHFMKDFPSIIMGQVIQKELSQLNLLLKVREENNTGEIQAFVERIRKFTDNSMKINIEYVTDLQLSPTGKYRPVISEII